MAAIHNPFIVGGYISPHYFCDREKETEQLIRNITNGRNVVIISTRRMGKTGLIRHCFYQNEIKEHYHTFFIDIYATSSLREFVFALGKERKATGVTSEKFIKKYRLSTPSSVQAALKGLQEKNLVSQEQNQYEISDKLLGVWLQKNY